MNTSTKYAAFGLGGIAVLVIALTLWSYLSEDGVGGPAFDTPQSPIGDSQTAEETDTVETRVEGSEETGDFASERSEGTSRIEAKEETVPEKSSVPTPQSETITPEPSITPPSAEPAPAPASPDPTLPQNGSLLVTRLFINQFSNTKYALTVRDPEGIASFEVKKSNGAVIYGGGRTCLTSVTSGTVTLLPADFPLTALIIDCRDPASQTNAKFAFPPLPPPADLFIAAVYPPARGLDGTYTVEILLANVGSGVTGSFSVRALAYYRDRTISLEQRVSTGIASQDTRSIFFTLDSVRGFQRMVVIADNKNEVVESNENNNTRELND